MAVTPKTDEAFLREVDEEVRRERIAELARRYGRIAIIGLVVALLLLAGYLFWRHTREQDAARQSEQLQAAFDKLGASDRDGAARDLKALAGSDRAVVRAVARMAAADLALQKDDVKGGAAQFDAIAGDDAMPQPYRDLATVRSVAARFDQLPPQQVIARLSPYAVAGKPWFGSAGEMVAIAHLRMGHRDQAGKLFAEIAKDDGVPPSIRQRAVQMAGATGVDAVAQVEDSKTR